MANPSDITIDPAFAWAFDENYLEPAVASIHSTLRRLPEGMSALVVVVATRVGPEHQERFEKWLGQAHPQAELRWIDGSTIDLPASRSHYSDAMFLRLSLAELLPDVDRILYLDPDTVVTEDPLLLWRESLEDHPIGAIHDSGIAKAGDTPSYARLQSYGLQPDSPYLNSGVLLIDLRRWRECGYGVELTKVALENDGQFAFPDQDVLNAVFVDNWRQLGLRFNAAADRLPAGEEGPIVVRHFVGPIKPWNAGIRVPGVWLYYRTLWDSGWRSAWQTAGGLTERLACTVRRTLGLNAGRGAA